jgi:uncharacterized protein
MIPPQDHVVRVLRDAGAVFAFVHGSRATGTPGTDSDLDVAAWWPADAPASWDVEVPGRVDLVVLNSAPLWLAGRVAQHGRLLFDDDPVARVRWQADTRLRYLDELPLRLQTVEQYLEAVAHGRR